MPNNSFEVYVTCPTNTSSLLPLNWFRPTSIIYYYNGPYFNSCTNGGYNVPHSYLGYQNSHTGNAHTLLVNYSSQSNSGRYYLESKLKDTLRKNMLYHVAFYVSLTDVSNFACNNVAAFLSKNKIYVDTTYDEHGVILLIPHILNYGNPIISDTMNWVKVSGIYKAQGGEQYITIGNFEYDNQTTIKHMPITSVTLDGAGYYLDDVSVIPLDSMCLKADAGRDTTIKAGDSVFIGSYTNGIDSLRWVTGLTVIDSIRPGFWVHPTTTTKYILCQQVNGCATCDTVTVTVQPLPLKITNYELRMINDKQVLNKWTTATEVNVSHYNILRSINGNDFTIVGKVKANNKAINEYQFTDNRQQSTVDAKLYYRIVGVDNDGKLTYSEVRTVNRQQTTNNSISVFPNPAKDIVNIECKEGINKIAITDYLGRTVYQSSVDHKPLTINTKQFTKGMYIVQVLLANGKMVNSKLVVE